MNKTVINYIECQIVEEDIQLSLLELCQASDASEDMIAAWVLEGVLEPSGHHPLEWQFSGTELRRTKLAQRLTEELELNTSGVALTLDLLERIDHLQAQLTRLNR